MTDSQTDSVTDMTISREASASKNGMFGYITSYICIGKNECSKLSLESNGEVLSSNAQPARLLGEGCKISKNNTPVCVYCGAHVPGLAVGNKRKLSERKSDNGLSENGIGLI